MSHPSPASPRSFLSVFVDRVLLSLPGIFLSLALLSLTTACSKPTDDKKQQVQAAIDTMEGEGDFVPNLLLQDAAKALKKALNGGRVFRDDMPGGTLAYTVWDQKTGSDGDEVHFGPHAFSSAADFQCEPEFIYLLDELIHEYLHMQQVEPKGATSLDRKINRMKSERDAYIEDLQWLKRIKEILELIKTKAKVPKHFEPFTKCSKDQLDAMINRCDHRINFKRDVLSWCNDRIASPDRNGDGVQDDEESPLSGGVTVIATGFFLSGVKEVFVGDAPATVLSVSDKEVQFITPAQSTGGHKQTIFKVGNGQTAFGPWIFYDSVGRIIVVHQPTSATTIVATGPTAFSIHAVKTNGAALAEKPVVLRNLITGTTVWVATTDSSGHATFSIDASAVSSCRVFIDELPTDLQWQFREAWLDVDFPKFEPVP